MKVRVKVVDAIRGRPADIVEFQVGAQRLAHFDPVPLRGADGNLQWAASAIRRGSPLRPGQRLVLPLRRTGQRTLSLIGTHWLAVDENGKVQGPDRGGECEAVNPRDIASVEWSELVGRAGACSQAELQKAEGRRALVERKWVRGQKWRERVAAVCTDPAVPEQPCNADSDCGKLEACMAGVCVGRDAQGGGPQEHAAGAVPDPRNRSR